MPASDNPGLSLSQVKWMGNADQNDPYIMARAKGQSFPSGGITSTLTNTAQNIGDVLAKAKTSISNAVNSFDPSNIRKSMAGLLGGLNSSSAKAAIPDVNFLKTGDASAFGGASSSGGEGTDWRVKVSLFSGTDFLYNDANNNFLSPVRNTNGVIFPVTPVIQMAHTARYASSSLTHSNYGMHFYEGSEIGEIQLNGEFPIQNIEEGRYLLAAIYFFRAATKMFWGQDPRAGTPPPMVKLTGYGAHYFPNVPCVIKSFTHTLPDDRDYIEVYPIGSSQVTRLPTQSTIQVTLQPVYSRSVVSRFSLSDFAKGNLLDQGYL